MLRKRRSALFGFLLAFIALTPISISPAIAAASATATGTVSFSTGTFKTFATATQTFTNPGAALSLTVAANTPKAFFVESGGTINQTAYTMTITNTGGGTIPKLLNCPINVTFATTTTCTGGVGTTTTAMTLGTAKTFTISFPANSWFEFELTCSKAGTASISVSVSSSQISTFTQNS
jgi:hypothetical protein